jgi:hypothetical protein
MSGDIKDIAIDSVGLAVDIAAALLPGVPGGASFAIKAARATVDVARVSGEFVDIAGAVVHEGNTGEIVTSALNIASTSLTRGAGKAFGRARDYAIPTKFGDRGNSASAVATSIDSGVAINDYINAFKEPPPPHLPLEP